MTPPVRADGRRLNRARDPRWPRHAAAALLMASACAISTAAPALPLHILPGIAASGPRVRAAYAHLEREMDHWITGPVVYDDVDSGGAAFFPSNRMGDHRDLVVDEASAEDPRSGDSCIRISYQPRKNPSWAGVYWTYPDVHDGNWGERQGRSLRGATRLTGWIRGASGGEIVELKLGGINRGPHRDPRKPYQDAFGPVTTAPSPRLRLAREWTPFEIAVPQEADLDHVIGGFAVVLSRAYNPGGATIYLDEVRYDRTSRDHLRLIRAYSRDPVAGFGLGEFSGSFAIRNPAYLYDSVLVELAFLARGDADGRRRARIIADSLVWAQEHDRDFSDGRLRNGYSSGPLEDEATRKARLPGWTHVARPDDPCPDAKQSTCYREDYYAAGTDVGNMAWAMIGLLTAHDAFAAGQPRSQYLDAAARLGEFVADRFRSTSWRDGFTGGIEGWDAADKIDRRLEWQSVEHNIDLYVAYTRLAQTTGDPRWKERARQARAFVDSLWDQKRGAFLMGTCGTRGEPNLEAVPTDPQTWSFLAMSFDPQFARMIKWSGPGVAPPPLDWIEKHCRVDSDPRCPGRAGYRFSTCDAQVRLCDGRERKRIPAECASGIWFEGSGHLALAYHAAGLPDEANRVLLEVEAANGGGPGGIAAACPHPAYTGMMKSFAPKETPKPWNYPQRYHVGATAWYILARRGVNPYWLHGPPNGAGGHL